MSTFLLTDSHSHSTTLSQKIRLNLLPASLLSVPFCFPSPLHYFRVNVTSCCSHLCSQNDTNFIKYCQQFLILGRHEYEGQGQISLVCLSSLSKICLPVLLQFSIAVTVFLLFLPLPLYPQDLFIHLKSSMIEREREIPCSLPNGCNSCSWARPKPEARKPCVSPAWAAGVQVLEPSLVLFSRHFCRELTRVKPALQHSMSQMNA